MLSADDAPSSQQEPDSTATLYTHAIEQDVLSSHILKALQETHALCQRRCRILACNIELITELSQKALAAIPNYLVAED